MTIRALELLEIPESTKSRPMMILDLGCGSGLSSLEISKAGHYWIGLDISRYMLNVADEKVSEFFNSENSTEDSAQILMESESGAFDKQTKEEEFSDASFSEETHSENDEKDNIKSSQGEFADLLQWDIGQSLSFRPGTIDGAVSISCIQWLCQATSSHPSGQPKARLTRFFKSLYMCLAQGARAVFQFYPESEQQFNLISSCAMRCGFGGGTVIDFPNSTKRKKYFLCLIMPGGSSASNEIPRALSDDMDLETDESQLRDPGMKNSVKVYERQRIKRIKSVNGKRKSIKDKDWLLRKKDARRKKGEEVPRDSKYTGRKRKPKF